MKILFIDWSNYGSVYWIEELKRQGHDVTHMSLLSLAEDDMQSQNEITGMVIKGKFDAICTFNFFPVLSIAARKSKCKYIAWVYDSPLLHLYSNETKSPYNYIFLFDKKQYKEISQKGINTVYHLPLAGVTELEDVFEECRYDVTFVGSLYRKSNFYDQINYLPEKVKGYLSGVMEAQRKVYGYYMLPELLTEDILREIRQYVKINLEERFWADESMIFSSLFLAKKLASLERESMLLHLAKFFKVNLYSDERLEAENIINCGTVPYGIEMYRLFRQSKINLNFTLRCIQSGVNLRTMDILSAGGFCLTNYQEELNEQFEIGKELVVYESEQDLLEKTAYYLKHEDLRKEIAANGRKRIEKSHNYEQRVRAIMDIVSGKQ